MASLESKKLRLEEDLWDEAVRSTAMDSSHTVFHRDTLDLSEEIDLGDFPAFERPTKVVSASSASKKINSKEA